MALPSSQPGDVFPAQLPEAQWVLHAPAFRRLEHSLEAVPDHAGKDSFHRLGSL
jgi:hypothetical protein